MEKAETEPKPVCSFCTFGGLYEVILNKQELHDDEDRKENHE